MQRFYIPLLIIISFTSLSCNNQGNPKEAPKQDSSLSKVDSNSITGNLKEEEFYFDSINTEALKLLFQADFVLDGIMLLWKPRPEDFITFHVSDDKYCHSRLDTIFKLKDDDLLVIVRTDHYHLNHIPNDAHSEAPVLSALYFSKEKKGYKLRNFKKDWCISGSWGERGEIGLLHWGDHEFLFNRSYFNGAGAEEEWTEYFTTRWLTSTLRFISLESNSGMYEETDPEFIRTEKSLNYTGKGKFMFLTKDWKYDEAAKKVKMTAITRPYIYDEQSDTFMPDCK